MATRFPKTHTPPCEVLKRVLFEDYGLTFSQAVEMLDILPATLSNFLKGKTKMSKDLAYRLDLAGIRTAQFWLNFQTGYDMVKFVNAITKKPKIAVAAFEKIRNELNKRIEQELENEKEIDELLVRKLERRLAERQAQNKKTELADDEFGDSAFDEPAEITPANVRRIREHAPTRAHAHA